MTVLDPPVFASTLRLIPYSVHPRIICLRFELHGCKDQSKLSMTGQGPHNKAVLGWTFITTLQGVPSGLSHGLGQFFDLGVPPFCPTAQPIRPNSHLPKQNWADSGTCKIKVNPT